MNVGTALETSVNQVVEAINAAAPHPIDLVYAEARSGEVKRIALANDKPAGCSAGARRSRSPKALSAPWIAS